MVMNSELEVLWLRIAEHFYPRVINHINTIHALVQMPLLCVISMRNELNGP